MPESTPPHAETDAKLRRTLDAYATPDASIYDNRDSIVLNGRSPAIPMSRPPRDRPVSMMIPTANACRRIREDPDGESDNSWSSTKFQESKNVRGSIMKKLFRRSKTPAPDMSRLGWGDPDESIVTMRSRTNGGGRRRRPMSEIVSNAIRGLGGNLNGFRQDSNGINKSGLKKEGSPRLSVKSLNIMIGKSTVKACTRRMNE